MSALVLSVNSAVDVTYTVPRLELGETTRVREAVTRAGGKAVNVARVLRQLGGPSFAGAGSDIAGSDSAGSDNADALTLLARIGEADRGLFERDAAEHGITLAPVIHPGATRRTIAVVESEASARTSMINEAGAPIRAHEWRAIAEALVERLPGTRVLVISGSMPSGLPCDFLPGLVSLGQAHGARVIVDTSGERLLQVGSADLVKPNEAELLEATGANSVENGLRELFSRGVKAVLLSRGEDGLALHRPGAPTIAAKLSVPLTGNPTGAGDAAVASATHSLLHGDDDATLVRRACAASAAAVLEPVAGVIPENWEDLLAQVEAFSTEISSAN